MSNKQSTPAPEVLPPETQVVEKAEKETAVVTQNKGSIKRRGRVENLIPYKPGVSGNPGGRPKKKWLTEVAEMMLEKRLSDPAYRKEYEDSLWQKLVSGRVVSAMTLDQVWNRTEGKLTQPIDVSGEIDITSIIESGRKRLKE